MNKKGKIILGICGFIVLLIGGILLYNYYRIKNAKIEVTTITDLTAEFNSDVKVKDYIVSINGKIIDNYKIDTTKLGEKKVTFDFVNDDNIKVSYTYILNIVDSVEPLIWLNNSYTVKVGSDIDLKESILCGDNYDNNPDCVIEGEYDLNTPGSYDLVYKATDNSGNIAQKNFTLNVYEPVNSTPSEDYVPQEESYIDFQDVIDRYKTADNKIGVDISKWQGEVDFQKLMAAGVEFVMLRLGGTRGIEGKYFIDETFKQNIKAANKEKIPVGIYFYSYANSSKKAIKDAKWVLKQIKKYDIDLPIAFDWEEWKNFNEYNLSFFGLTTMAEDFLKTVEAKGYKGMLYSSKTYLENMWLETDYDIWLAHYTNQTDYDKDYKMWQICDNGRADGIKGNVDIDIMYK